MFNLKNQGFCWGDYQHQASERNTQPKPTALLHFHLLHRCQRPSDQQTAVLAKSHHTHWHKMCNRHENRSCNGGFSLICVFLLAAILINIIFLQAATVSALFIYKVHPSMRPMEAVILGSRLAGGIHTLQPSVHLCCSSSCFLNLRRQRGMVWKRKCP